MLKEELRIYYKLCKVSTTVFDDGQGASISILNHIHKKDFKIYWVPQLCIGMSTNTCSIIFITIISKIEYWLIS